MDNTRNQIIFWAFISTALIAFLYLFQSILTPFVLGVIIAYLLNPLVALLNKIKLNRGVAALIILCGFFVTLGLALILIIPIISTQLSQFIDELPNYTQTTLNWLKPHLNSLIERFNLEQSLDPETLIKKNVETLKDLSSQILGGLAAGSQTIFNTISLIIFTPITAYFFLKEWDVITAWVEDLMPKDHKNTILDLLNQINQKISGVIRGQIIIAIFLGIGYAIALSIAGLKYGALIGIISGLLSIIPMVGSITGLVVSLGVAWFQTFDIGFVGIIAAIFIVGQLIEGNILSPKIMGDNVGLHPLWVFFALFAGSALLGILGMLIAVPVAAIIGVLLAFAIAQYKQSKIYTGKSKDAKKAQTKPSAKPKKLTNKKPSKAQASKK